MKAADGVAAAEYADLKQLGEIEVDDVLGIIDRPVPDYRHLYYRWERQQWEAGSIDLGEDRTEWIERLSPELKRSLLSTLAPFCVAKEQIASALVPFVDAAPTEEQQVFLTTQLVDQARHVVFFDRFYSSVVEDGESDMTARLDAQKRRLNAGASNLLLEMLPEVSGRIRADPADSHVLVEGAVLCHLIIQGMLGLTGQRFLLDYVRDHSLLPGFRQGFTAVARDEARHVAFAMKFLSEMVEQDARCATVVEAVVQRAVPVTLGAFESPEPDGGYLDARSYGPDDLRAFALASMRTRLDRAGVAVELPL